MLLQQPASLRSPSGLAKSTGLKAPWKGKGDPPRWDPGGGSSRKAQSLGPTHGLPGPTLASGNDGAVFEKRDRQQSQAVAPTSLHCPASSRGHRVTLTPAQSDSKRWSPGFGLPVGRRAHSGPNDGLDPLSPRSTSKDNTLRDEAEIWEQQCVVRAPDAHDVWGWGWWMTLPAPHPMPATGVSLPSTECILRGGGALVPGEGWVSRPGRVVGDGEVGVQ